LKLKCLALKGHRERLRDSLTEADGQGTIVIGVVSHAFGNELLARNSAHRSQYALVGNSSAAELVLHHPMPQFVEILRPLRLLMCVLIC